MTIRTTVLLTLIALCQTWSVAQSTYQRQISLADSSSFGLATAVLPSGNIAVGGYIENASTPGLWDAAVWMFDPQGNLQWAQKYRTGQSDDELITDLIAGNDGTLIATLVSARPNTGTFSTLMKINASGNIIWSNQVSDNNATFVHVAPSRNGYVVTGSVFLSGVNLGLVLNVLESGTSNWLRVFKTDISNTERAVQDDQGNYFVVGMMNNEAMLTKINETGTVQWTRTYGSSQTDIFREIQILSDNRLLMAGNSSGFGAGFTEIFAMQTDLDGNIRWSKSYGIASTDISTSGLRALPDGSALMPLTETGNVANSGAVLTRIDVDGNLTLQNSYGIEGKDARFSAFDLLNDTGSNGIVATGTQRKGNDISLLLVRTDNANQNYRVAVCCPKNVSLEVKNIQPVINNLLPPVGFGNPMTSISVSKTAFSGENTDLCPEPNTNFSISDTLICSGECINISFPAPTNGVQYSWTFQGATPGSSTLPNPANICYATAGKNQIVLNANGCPIAYDTIVVSAPINAMPNAFTPNGDDFNEILMPVPSQCPVEEYHMEVFNRWGILVFESFSPTEGWDGTVNGEPSPIDVYICRVEYYSVVNGQRTLIKNEMKQVSLIR